MNQDPNHHPEDESDHHGQETHEYGGGEEFITTFTPRAKEPYWKRIGGGSLSLSILVHVVLFAVAFFLIKFSIDKKKEEVVDFLPGGGGGGKSSQAKMANKRKSVTMNTPKTRIAANVSTSAVTLPDVQTMNTDTSISGFAMPAAGGVGGGDGGLRGGGRGGLQGNGVGRGNGPGSGVGFVGMLPPSMRSRCSPQERAEKMRTNGGNEDCEKAVVKALDWLKTKQNADGSWGSTKAGITGLALLAYYGHCETPESPFYGQNVTSGIAYLTDLSLKNKGFFSEAAGVTKSCVYEHGIACYAMGETYSFSKLLGKPMPKLRETFENGVNIIIQNQQSNGNWSYPGDGGGYAKSGREDMSVTGWQFQALKAAKHTNLKIQGLPSAIHKAVDYLESRLQPEGGFGHNGVKRGDHYSQYTMTGIGVLGLQTLAGGSTSKANKGLRFLEEELGKDPLDWKKNANLYCWYYNTQAFFQKGGKEWEEWNKQCREQILKHQRPDGSYEPETTEGGHVPGGADTEVYRTCLCTLMLEVYYRYLKVGNGE